MGDHRNVISVLEFFESPRPCIIMRFVDGGTLWEHLEKRSTIPFDQAMHILSGLADGLTHLHSNGFVHRDFKSPNVLMDQGKEPVIIDLGMGKAWKADFATQQTMGMRGTPFWMAPEMLQNNEYSEKTDMYAYGIVMFEVLACDKPYTDKDLDNIARFLTRIADGSLRPNAARLRGSVPEWCIAIMTACWDPNPKMRPTALRVRQMLLAEGKTDMDPHAIFDSEARQGSLSQEAFARAILRLDPTSKSEDHARLFRIIDKDHSNSVEFDEFLTWFHMVERVGIKAAMELGKDVSHVGGQLDPIASVRSTGSTASAASDRSRPVTSDDVVHWLESINLRSLVPIFSKENIDGDGLAQLNSMSIGEIKEFLQVSVTGGDMLRFKQKLKEMFSPM